MQDSYRIAKVFIACTAILAAVHGCNKCTEIARASAHAVENGRLTVNLNIDFPNLLKKED